MSLDDITDGAEENHKKDRAERLGLTDVEDLENVEAMQTRLSNQRSLLVGMDSRIERLEDEISSMRRLMHELLEVYKDGNKANNPERMAEEEKKSDGDNKEEDGDGWEIDL